MRVYYLTSTKWAEVILKERRLKLARFGELNDPFELSLIDSRQRDTRKVVKPMTDYFAKTIGVICFGANWASPVIWAHYGDKHFGVALGFDVQGQLLTRIQYTDKKIPVPFGSHLPKYGLSAALLSKVRMTKATDWSYEREYRVESALRIKDPVTGLYYVDCGPHLALREVIVGHRCGWTAGTIRPMLGTVSQRVRICKARPAFGRFEMVENEQFKPVAVKPKKSAA
jgi:Protein of unknown function (DUF2971)